MDEYFEVEKGKIYRLMVGCGTNPWNIVGVREEGMSPTYSTFFGMVHDIRAAMNGDTFSFVRIKAPLETIKVVEGNRIVTGAFERNNIWYDEKKEERGEFVKSWLDESAGILSDMGYVNPENIFRGNRDWSCRSYIPACVRLKGL